MVRDTLAISLVIVLLLCAGFSENPSPAPLKVEQKAVEIKKDIPTALEYKITAYSPNFESTGKSPGHPLYKRTATGTTATEGRTIAADFDVLKPGTVVEIEGIGKRVVEDCGGAVEGRHIDLYFETTKQAVEFGVQKRKVRVIE